MQAVIRFDTTQRCRFLSHQEMVSVFQRALIRSGLNPRFSQGFNPRPKLTLPLPRTVGLVTYGDCALTMCDPPNEYSQEKVACQLPEGISISEFRLHERKQRMQAVSAHYVFTLKTECTSEVMTQIHDVRQNIQSNQPIVISRLFGPSRPEKTVDIGPFIAAVHCDQKSISVEYRITPKGSVRFSEIMNLFGLAYDDLAEPVVRRSVQWIDN